MKVWLAIASIAACQGEAPKAPPAPEPKVQTDITAEDYRMPALPMGKVTLVDKFGGRHTVEVEIAATDAARTRGLMWRRNLAEGKGMLFIFKGQRFLTFWMKNTLISLDMIFADEALNVVGVVERAEPKTLQSRGVGAPAKYVLEVPAGYWTDHGLKAGTPMTVEGAEALVVEH